MFYGRLGLGGGGAGEASWGDWESSRPSPGGAGLRRRGDAHARGGRRWCVRGRVVGSGRGDGCVALFVEGSFGWFVQPWPGSAALALVALLKAPPCRSRFHGGGHSVDRRAERGAGRGADGGRLCCRAVCWMEEGIVWVQPGMGWPGALLPMAGKASSCHCGCRESHHVVRSGLAIARGMGPGMAGGFRVLILFPSDAVAAQCLSTDVLPPSPSVAAGSEAVSKKRPATE